MKLVLDASLALACCFDDERTPLTDALTIALPIVGAAVSPIWYHEVANILHGCKVKGRVTDRVIGTIVDSLLALPLVAVDQSAGEVLRDIRELADAQALSAYDASYLHVALTTGLPLGTLDGSGRKPALKHAALRSGVELVTIDHVRGWLEDELR